MDKIRPQTHTWPRLIGGPIHGTPIPEDKKDAKYEILPYVTESRGKADTVYYQEVSYRFGNIRLRAYVSEGSSQERYSNLKEDILIHALASVGISVQK